MYLHRKEGYVNYIFIFSIGFYFVNFVYPIFYFPYNPYFSLFQYWFDTNLISYCTAVAYCAYSFLSLGLTPKKSIKRISYNMNRFTVKTVNIPIKTHDYLIKSLFSIFIAILIVFLSTGGLYYFTHQFSGETNASDIESGYIFSLLQAVVYPLWILVLIYPHKKSNIFRIPFVCLAGFISIILLTGSRTLPIALIIIWVGIYNDFIKKLSLSKILIGVIFSAIILTLAGALRGSGEMISTDSIMNSGNVLNDKDNVLDFAQSLIINNRSLYSLIGYAKTHTYTFGITLISAILNVVPFMVTGFSSITGIHPDFLGSATFNTFLSSGHFRHQGLGTNAVSDIYVAFGLLGVVVLFYFFGRIILWLKDNNRRNIYYCIAYYVILSGAIYTCRSTIFGNLKPIVWSIFIVWLLIKISPVHSRIFKQNQKKGCQDYL